MSRDLPRSVVHLSFENCDKSNRARQLALEITRKASRGFPLFSRKSTNALQVSDFEETVQTAVVVSNKNAEKSVSFPPKLCQFVVGRGPNVNDPFRRFHPTLGRIGKFEASKRDKTNMYRPRRGGGGGRGGGGRSGGGLGSNARSPD